MAKPGSCAITAAKLVRTWEMQPVRITGSRGEAVPVKKGC